MNRSTAGQFAKGIIKRWKAPTLIQVLKAEANVDLDSSISALRDGPPWAS